MNKYQWLTVGFGLALVILLYAFGRTVPRKEPPEVAQTQHSPDDGHDHSQAFSTDTILTLAKKGLKAEQAIRINTLENSISRGDVKDQQLMVYRQLARFWADSVGIFEPYAWFTAEAARLENSQKTLNFAARLFLDNLQNDHVGERKKWKALQAKDLFERSLNVNPEDDSAKVGLGATLLFGEISATPMEGIRKINDVIARDSSNIYAHMMLVRGALVSGQYDRAISRLETIIRLEPANADAIVWLADVYAYTEKKEMALSWYRKSLEHIKRPDARKEIEKRIEDLKK